MRCDSHVHIIGPIERYPQLATRTYLALPASLDALSRAAEPSGVTHFVIVQPSFYGADNTALLESLDVLGPRGRGVAVIDPAQTSKAMLDGFAVRGVRGLRINLYSPGKASGGRLARDFAEIADPAAAMGWHVEVIAPLAVLAEAAGILAGAGVAVVIDHYGVHGHSTPDSADGRALLELLALPHVWMKLSAPYRVSDDPLNTRPDPAWLAAILERAKERCLWGSDWPHTPGHDAQHGPEVAGVYRPLPYKTVVDDFIAALGSDALSQMIMSDNPARLYGFSFAPRTGSSGD
jgi:predicted TIM-barrel fold metal-dependent hydrolase